MKGSLTQEMFQCIPEIEFNIGCRYFLGNMENYTKALLSTLKSIRSKLSLLRSMIYSEEFEGLRTISQTLRIMLANVGAVTLSEETYLVETVLLNGGSRQVKEHLSSYIANLMEFAEHLEILLKKVDSKPTARSDEEPSSFMNFDFTKTRESIRRSSNYLDRRII